MKCIVCISGRGVPQIWKVVECVVSEKSCGALL